MSPAILITLQTISAIGFGVNLSMMMILTTVPNGGKIVAQLFDTVHPPIVTIVAITMLCGLGTIAMTLSNAQNTRWKESYLESRKQISS